MKHFLTILLIYSILMAAMGITLDTVNTLKYGAIDLRNRVVGTRVLLSGADPYFFKWDNNTPEEMVDARDIYSDLPVSRLTVPPSLLLLHAPLQNIPYKLQQIIWAISQWLLLLISIILLSDLTRSIIKKKIIWIIGLFLIASNYYWRTHVDKGQIYILFVTLMVISYWLLEKKKNDIFSGFILGVTASFRPTIILFGIPFLIKKRWKFIISGISGILLSFSLSLIITPLSIWKSYFRSVEFHEKFHLLIIEPVYGLFNANIVDGIKNPVFSANLPIEDSSIQDIIRAFFDLKVMAGSLEISLLVVLIILTVTLWKRIQNSKSDLQLFFIGTVFVIISSYFLPAARLSYMNVYWLIPLSFYVITIEDLKQILKPELALLVIGIILNTAFNIFPKGIILSDYLFLLYFVIVMFRITKIVLIENQRSIF